MAVLIHFAFLFAANLYLVLAARMLADPRLCVNVWRYRFAIDFIIALGLVLLRVLR